MLIAPTSQSRVVGAGLLDSQRSNYLHHPTGTTQSLLLCITVIGDVHFKETLDQRCK